MQRFYARKYLRQLAAFGADGFALCKACVDGASGTVEKWPVLALAARQLWRAPRAPRAASVCRLRAAPGARTPPERTGVALLR